MICRANVGDSTGNIICVKPGINEYSIVIEMSVEHRADRSNKDEEERIEQLGGMIYNKRVNETLAVIRTLWDIYLKPYLSNEPFCKTVICDKN